MKCSVVICTHNPRQNYLRAVLDALKAQTLPMDQWELRLIDNASKEPLSDSWDLSWHANASHIREDELGLTPARLRGIRETKGEVLVFVDDDNVLAVDYLDQALKVAAKWPILGAWGGSVAPSFEVPPPTWLNRYLGWLALREVREDNWSNLRGQYATVPYGAGMCVRRAVAVEYARGVASEPVRLALDRRGNQLFCAGDTDLAVTSCDLGLGMGVFSALKLTHLIPANRLTEVYMCRLLEGMAFSSHMLAAARGEKAPRSTMPGLIWGHINALAGGLREYRLYRAPLRGARAGFREGSRWRAATQM